MKMNEIQNCSSSDHVHVSTHSGNISWPMISQDFFKAAELLFQNKFQTDVCAAN